MTPLFLRKLRQFCYRKLFMENHLLMVPVSVDLKLLSPLQCTESFLQPDTRSPSRKKLLRRLCSAEPLKKLPGKSWIRKAMSRKLKQNKTVTLFFIYYLEGASLRFLYKSLLYTCRHCCIPYPGKDLKIQISFFIIRKISKKHLVERKQLF